jgi:hypothetical protein
MRPFLLEFLRNILNMQKEFQQILKNIKRKRN